MPAIEINASHLLELRTAERDLARDALDGLEAMVQRVGGHMKPEDQIVLRHASAVLEQLGARRKGTQVHKPVTPAWAVKPAPRVCINHHGTPCPRCGL